MSDTLQTVREPFTESDLRVRSEPLEVTPDLVAANLSFGADQFDLPDEMMNAVRRIYQDHDFVWPTTVAVTRISSAAGDRTDTTAAWTRVSVLGTGYEPGRAVSLSLRNVSGRDSTVHLTDVKPDDSGFFGVDVILKSVEKRSAEWAADAEPVTLVAQQSDGGRVIHSAEQGGLPAHVLWQWVR